MEQQIDKLAYDEEFRTCDFSTVIDSADTVVSGTAVIFDDASGDVSSSMISDVSVATGNKGLRYKLKAGTSGKKYSLKVRISTASNQKFEEPFTVCII